MGLDIKFNLSAAVAAGMAMRKEVVGTAAEIEEAKGHYANAPCESNERHLIWLTAEQLLGNIPDYKQFFCVDIVDNDALVRANTWGSLYDPLTSFLGTNNITWYEI